MMVMAAVLSMTGIFFHAMDPYSGMKPFHAKRRRVLQGDFDSGHTKFLEFLFNVLVIREQ